MSKSMSRTKGAIAVVFALWLGMGMSGKVSADTAFTGEKWTDSIKLNGDLRLRHEDFFNKRPVNSGVDRHRERFRMRLGVTATIQDFTAGVKFASGSGEQTSTNQTFTNSSSQKALYIDQAYLQWKAHEHIKLTGGKMPNPIWRTYSSDIMWDNDLNPEGYAQQFDMTAGDRLSLFANFAQLPLNEISGSNGDPWVFAHQIGLGLKVTEDTTWRFGTAFYGFINERKNVLLSTAAVDSAVVQEANTRVAGSAQLASSFKILDLTTELATHVGPFPLSLQGDFVRNMASGNALLGAQNANGQVTGYQYGLILGKAKSQGTWEAAYFRKWVQANAVVSDWADSDWGNGGTNRKGHIFWLSYAVRDYVTVTGKYFMTSKLNRLLSSSTPYGLTTENPSDINRFQMDVVVKF